MDYKRIYNDIMNMDPKIRLVTICDNNGKIMSSVHREGVQNLLSQEESKKSLELGSEFLEKPQRIGAKDWERKICIGRIRKDQTYHYAIGRQASTICDNRGRMRCIQPLLIEYKD